MDNESAIQNAYYQVGGAVVVVAKCPIAGVSKTRLAPLLGAEGAARLAQAMLSDVLVSLNECGTLKVLLYAPDTKAGEFRMSAILQSLNLPYYVSSSATTQQYQDLRKWILLPMKSSSASSDMNNCKSDLISSSLGDKLENALERTRELIRMIQPSTVNGIIANESILFLGMDSPELPMEEVVYGLQISSGDKSVLVQRQDEIPHHKKSKQIMCIEDSIVETSNGRAHLCPAVDGGYGLISIPKHAPSSRIFSGVRWSQPLTAVSQLKALTDSNINVSIGKMMHDVDEPSDVHHLVKRLLLLRYRNNDTRTNSSSKQSETEIICDTLTSLSAGSSTSISITTPRPFPRHTWKALVDMNFVVQEDSSSL